MDQRRVETSDVVQEAMPDLLGDTMASGDREVAIYGDRQRCFEGMAQPA
jgi:hypothetical protein